MSIATRINAIEEHIGNAYKKIDDLGIDLTNVDKNIDNIAEMLDTVYEDYPKVTGTGTEVSLNGTKVGKLSLDVKGNSTQDGTPSPTNEVPILSAGENLNELDISKSTLSVYLKNQGETASSTASDTSDYMPVYANSTYQLTYDYVTLKSTNTRAVCFYDEDKQFISTTAYTSTNKTNTITVAQKGYVRITYDKNCTDIKFIKNGVGFISEKITNKNWIPTDVSDWGQGTIINGVDSDSTTRIRTKKYYRIKYNNSYYVSIEDTNYCFLNILFYDSNKNYVDQYYTINPAINGTRGLQVNVPNNSNIYYIRVTIRNTNNSATITPNEVTDIKPMIVEGTTKTDFVAHQEQTYTIPVQQPMRSIGTVRDEFIKINGEWKERHNITRLILTGTETWTMYSANYFYADLLNSETNKQIKCNYYTVINPLSTMGEFVQQTQNIDYAMNSHTDYNAKTLRMKDARFSTLNDLKSWLAEKYASNNPVYVDYIPSTLTDLPCTAEQVECLENLPKSYNEQTNIYSLDVTPAYIEAKALKGE